MTAAREFLAAFARARAEEVVDTPGGFAVRSPRRYPHAHDHNSLYVLAPVDRGDLLAAGDAVLADRPYRRLDHLAGETPAPLAAALTAAGYERATLVTMTATRAPDDDRPGPDGVVDLALDERVAFAERMWSGEFAERDPAVLPQLADRARGATTAARCTFLGIVGAEGVEASCDVFVRGDVAQIEEVGTLEGFRGRGHASRLVRAARERAAGASTVFLVAGADDWPRQLYTRLGFDVTDRHDVWTRLP